MPTIDPLSVPHIQRQMREGRLVIIGDVHNSPLTRALVQAVLATGTVKRLFIEAPHTLKAGSGSACKPHVVEFGDTLRAALDTMWERRTDKTNAEKVLRGGGYFSIKLGREMHAVGGGATPDLIELAALAVSLRTEVIPADADYNAVMDELSAEDGNVSLIRLFQDQGIGIRDRQAAHFAATRLRDGGDATGNLMLWGMNHLRGNEARKSLTERLEENGVKCDATPEVTAFYSSVV